MNPPTTTTAPVTLPQVTFTTTAVGADVPSISLDTPDVLIKDLVAENIQDMTAREAAAETLVNEYGDDVLQLFNDIAAASNCDVHDVVKALVDIGDIQTKKGAAAVEEFCMRGSCRDDNN